MNRGVLGQLRERGDIILAAGVFGLLGIVLVPLPPLILDLLLGASVSFSIMLFLAALYARKPVDLSAFPIMLLMATVYRLALNIASTRLILLDGGNGSHAAGRIIQSFGNFVVGGNYIVGFVVFSILVVINFVVITKGSGRVAEVAARFTLDAMPGKQMAIDAELNAGLLDEQTARKRRSEVTREADFYGAMDGASKFVRGDAIAGIVITLINCVGGVFIGVVQLGMPVNEALHTYTILTIGDGLVGQVPALIVSTAAGLLVTRVADDEGRPLHAQLGMQLVQNPRVLGLAAGAIGCFALIPGMRLPFSIIALTLGYVAWEMKRAEKEQAPKAPATVSAAEASPEELLLVEPLAIEVAADLLYLVDERRDGELVERIKRIRKQFARDLGVVLPPVHLRDNLRLDNGQYRILLREEEIGRGSLSPRRHLALDPGSAEKELKGIRTTDPVFGLPAYWIPDKQMLEAQASGYTVVDLPTVLSTHLVELLHTFSHELFDTAQLDRVLERLSVDNPRLVDDLVPEPLSRHLVLRIFRNLIREGVSTRDSQSILEALADYAPRTQDADVLTEFVRQRLARHITRRFTDDSGQIAFVSLDPGSESLLLRSLQTEDGAPRLMLPPSQSRQLLTQVKQLIEGHPGPTEAILLVPPLVRGALHRAMWRALPRIPVVSSSELLPTVRLQRVGTIQLQMASSA